MDYQKAHDELTDRYYRQGNPDKLTPGQFILAHDAIWVEKDLAEGKIAQDEADIRMDNVTLRAQIAAIGGVGN